MKTIAYCALLYGADYLSYAIRSVIDAVDEFWVLYTPVGSHGARTQTPCPDRMEDLREIAQTAAGNKLRWVESTLWAQEYQQRGAIHLLVPDADVVLVVDADEVFEDGFAQAAIDFAWQTQARTVRLPFWHLWRSFRRGFMHDPAFPERVIVPKAAGASVTMPTDQHVWHFGYAQRDEIVAYKLLTHGHRAEFRHDVDWLRDIFMTNRQTDCHPVGSEWWNCEDMDMSRLPRVLADHPFRELDVIGRVIGSSQHKRKARATA